MGCLIPNVFVLPKGLAVVVGAGSGATGVYVGDEGL